MDTTVRSTVGRRLAAAIAASALSLGGAVVVSATAAHAAAPSTAARPRVNHVLPRHTSTQVQSRVTITGRHFRRVRSVWFGGAQGTQVRVFSDHMLRVTAPREPAGRVRVRVVTRAGTTGRTREAHFTYRELPARLPTAEVTGRNPDGTGSITLSWRASRSFDRSAVVIRRAAGRVAPSSPSQGTRVAWLSGRSGGSWTDHAVRIGRRYSYALFTRSSHKVFSRPADLTTWIPRGAWTGQQVDELRGGPDAVSCVASGFCAVGDDTGKVLTYDGTTWSRPVQIPRPAGSPPVETVFNIACASASFCVAFTYGSGGGEEFSVYNGSTWSDAQEFASEDHISSLTCVPNTTTCYASLGGVGNRVVAFDGTAWRVVATFGESFESLSCPTPSYCMGVGNEGVYTDDHGVWSGPTSLGSGMLAEAVSCGAEADCLVLTLDAQNQITVAHHLHAGTWDSTSLKGRFYLSCVSTTWCLAAEQSGGPSETFDGSAWTAAAPTNTYVFAVSCASRSQCLDIESPLGQLTGPGRFLTGAGEWQGSTWATVDVDPESGAMTDVSCPSTTFCAAVDQAGKAVVFDGTSWSAPAPFDSHPRPFDEPDVAKVSCASSSFCAAIRTNGFVSTYDGTSWSPSVSIDPNYGGGLDIDCPRSTFCVAIDGTDVMVYDGTSWSAPRVLDLSGLSSVSCASATRCVAVDAARRALAFDGRHWSGSRFDRLGPGDASVSCPTTSFCMAVAGSSPRVSIWRGAGWTMAPVPGVALDGVSCSSATSCSAYDDDGAAYAFDGARWSASEQVSSGGQDSPDQHLTGLSCAAPGWCRAVSQQIAYARGS